ncbi:hypothetical protein [Methanospirillum sp.]
MRRRTLSLISCYACFSQEAPVLWSGNRCYESGVLFMKDGMVNPVIIHGISGKMI